MRINLADSKGQIIVSVEIKKGDTKEGQMEITKLTKLFREIADNEGRYLLWEDAKYLAEEFQRREKLGYLEQAHSQVDKIGGTNEMLGM